MKVASALAVLAFGLFPTLVSAEPHGYLQEPPAGWTKVPSYPTELFWYRGNQQVRVEVYPKRGDLRSYIEKSFIPAITRAGGHVSSSTPISICGGRQRGWYVAGPAPRPGARSVGQYVVALDGHDAYVAAYVYRATDPVWPEAERAIRTLCMKPA